MNAKIHALSSGLNIQCRETNSLPMIPQTQTRRAKTNRHAEPGETEREGEEKREKISVRWGVVPGPWISL
jgi:hypothetical protein